MAKTLFILLSLNLFQIDVQADDESPEVSTNFYGVDCRERAINACKYIEYDISQYRWCVVQEQDYCITATRRR